MDSILQWVKAVLVAEADVHIKQVVFTYGL